MASLVRWAKDRPRLPRHPRRTARAAPPAATEPGALRRTDRTVRGIRTLLGGPIGGPHLIVVRRRVADSNDPPSAGTIEA